MFIGYHFNVIRIKIDFIYSFIFFNAINNYSNLHYNSK